MLRTLEAVLFVQSFSARHFGFVIDHAAKIDLVEIVNGAPVFVKFLRYNPVRDKPDDGESPCFRYGSADVNVEWFVARAATHRAFFFVTRETRAPRQSLHAACPLNAGIDARLEDAIIGRRRKWTRETTPHAPWVTHVVQFDALDVAYKRAIRNCSILARGNFSKIHRRAR